MMGTICRIVRVAVVFLVYAGNKLFLIWSAGCSPVSTGRTRRGNDTVWKRFANVLKDLFSRSEGY